MRFAIFILAFLTLSLDANTINFKSGKKNSSYYDITKDLSEKIMTFSNNSIRIHQLDSSGSIENIQILDKKIPENYVFTAPVVLMDKLKNGDINDEKLNKNLYKNIRTLFIFPYASMHFIIRKDAQIKIFEDMENKKILIAKGSFGAYEAKEYVQEFGLKGKITFIEDDLSKAVKLLASKKIDGFVSLSPYPSSSVLDAKKQTPITLLTLDSERVYQVGRKEGLIPANTYEGINENIITANLAIGVYTTKNLSETTAYRLTRAFWNVKIKLEEKSDFWKDISYQDLSFLKTKLHKGALRYYDEMGVYVPSNIR